MRENIFGGEQRQTGVKIPNGRYCKSDNDRRIYFEPHSICGKRIVGLRFCIVSIFVNW